MKRTATVITVLALSALAIAGCTAPGATVPETPVPSLQDKATPTEAAPTKAAATQAAATRAAHGQVDPSLFAHPGGHYLKNAAGDVWCGVVPDAAGRRVVGCQTDFDIPEVDCAAGTPLFEFIAGVEPNHQCNRDAMFIDPGDDSAVLADGQSVTIGTSTFVAERGGITLSGAPLKGRLHLSRSAGAEWAD